MGDLQRLLNPQSIAYVGGSQIAGSMRASMRAGYAGRIYVVNPVKDQVEGVACIAQLADLPEVPDAVVVGLSPERSITAVAEAAQLGCGGAVVMSSGFAELRNEVGRARQQSLIKAAADMPLLGPNCLGLLNQFSGAAVWGDDNHIERQDGEAAAIISQSGALMIGFTNVEQAFPAGYVMSVGNQAVTSMAELVRAVLADERIKAIGLYLEGINDAEALGQACYEAALQSVPVVALKGGDQAAGAEVALSHTASMVVERDLWEAFCRRYGVEEVSTPKAMVETLKLLSVAGLPQGNRISIASYSGGLNGLAATRAATLGLELPMPTSANVETLTATLPETVAIHNPIDLNIPYRDSRGGISMQDTAGVAKALVAFAETVTDQLVFFIDVPREGAAGLDKVWCDSMEALIEVSQSLGIPVLVAGIMPEGLPLAFRRHMQKHGVAALCGYAETMEALAVSARVSQKLRQLQQGDAPPHLQCSPGQPSVLENTSSYLLNEAQGKQALQTHGLKTAAFKAASIADVGTAAEVLGYPLALKVLSQHIAHKARVGGVKLNLNNREAVEQATEQMMHTVAAAEGGHAVTEVLLERMIDDVALELIVGIKRHPAMGLAMMIGLGGSQAEVMARFTTCLLPLTASDLSQALHYLGVTDCAMVIAVEQACHAIEAYALQQNDHLITLDVNPLMLTHNGQALAADALIVLEGG